MQWLMVVILLSRLKDFGFNSTQPGKYTRQERKSADKHESQPDNKPVEMAKMETLTSSCGISG